ncbi:MAG: hypothetical protein FRX49_11541 [Trebouxia sp. A1-2]|nr:MAG: hypothetical protein FRX49_11541 [Trebouxia sp. A1-2]
MHCAAASCRVPRRVIAAVLLIPGPRVSAAGKQNSTPGTEISRIFGVGLTAGPTQSICRFAAPGTGAASMGMHWLPGGRPLGNLKQAGGHTALAFAGGCLQQGNKTLGLQPSPEFPSLMAGARGRSPNWPLPKKLSGISEGDKLASAKGTGMGIEFICLTPCLLPLAVDVSDVALGCMPSEATMRVVYSMRLSRAQSIDLKQRSSVEGAAAAVADTSHFEEESKQPCTTLKTTLVN